MMGQPEIDPRNIRLVRAPDGGGKRHDILWRAKDRITGFEAAADPLGFRLRPGDNPSPALTELFVYLLARVVNMEQSMAAGSEPDAKA